MRQRRIHILAIALLILIFVWVYGRFAPRLFFVLDDYIETEAALSRTFWQAIRDSFSGAINWSGYRPVAYAVRATMAHAFRLDNVVGYYLAGMALHLANTLLTFRLVRRVTVQIAWAFLAAAWVQLLPSHNEAVLYMSANASLLALFFSLLTLDFSLSARRKGPSPWGATVLAATAYALAVLSYEVVLVLPLFVLLADWAVDRSAPRRHMRLYAAFGVALAVVVVMRVLASPPSVVRADYLLSANPLHIARGYAILLGQMVLLHSSPAKHLPLFAYLREWMAPANPRALASMLLVGGMSALTVFFALRAPTGKPSSDQRPKASFWLIWGLLWLLAFSLPFAALAGRNPENRYTYIPSFGFAVAIAALTAWLYYSLRNSPALRWTVIGLAVGALTFYAYVDTSDVSEWERASNHARHFYEGALGALPLLPTATTVAQVGVPGSVGGAYVFTTDESFDAAMHMRYNVPTGHFPAGDLATRRALLDGDPLVLLGYDRESGSTQALTHAVVCTGVEDCVETDLTPAPIIPTPAPWVYAQLYDENDPETGGLALLADDGAQPRLRSCWAFSDLERVDVDPASFNNFVLAARCRETFAALVDAGRLGETH